MVSDECVVVSGGVNVYRLIQGVLSHWASPKKLKYGKPRLGESVNLH